MSRHALALVIPSDASRFELACALDFLVEPPIGHDGDWYDVALIGDRHPTSAGLDLVPFESKRRFQTLIVLPSRLSAPDPQIVSYLRRADLAASRTVSICTGALTLAEAGLLRKRRATTHWRYGNRLRKIDSTIRLIPDVLYVDEGDVLTSAGAAAGIDLLLHLVRGDFGVAVAAKVAQAMVVAPHREGGHPQFLNDPVLPPDQGRLGIVVADMKANPERHYTIDELAHRSALSRRSFQRHFAGLTGLSPRDWLMERRVERAVELLRLGERNLENVANRSGFGGADQMRHHFRQRLGHPPSRYLAHN